MRLFLNKIWYFIFLTDSFSKILVEFVSNREVNIKLFFIEALSVGITSIDFELSAKDIKLLTELDIGWFSEILSIRLSWLVEGKFLWEFLSTEHQRERISTAILEVDFTDFEGIVSEIVMENIGDVWEDKEF